jgi:hypothetical protein
MMGLDLFIYHGYMELYLEGKWIKATPAFDLETCQENRWIPVEFDGKHDAILHTHSSEGKLHIEYVVDHGCYDDLPINDIFTAFEKGYGFSVEYWNKLVAEEMVQKTAN